MFRSLKRSWSELRHGLPGHRFRDRHARAARAGRGPWARAFRVVLALVLVLVGVLLTFLPGPAIVAFLIAASLLAAESAGVARLLDRLELRLRSALRRLRRAGRDPGREPPSAA